MIKYILYDLEATCWKQNPLNWLQEVIEIGAYKLNLYGEVTDEYHAYIRPVVHPEISHYCSDLTGISNEDVLRAPRFSDEWPRFLDWCEIYEGETWLIAWGDGDRRLAKDNGEIYDLEDDWLSYYVNLKSRYRQLRSLPRQVGLKKAISMEGMEFEGEAHRALDDAKNLTKLFVRHIGEWQL